jgi:REP element-mobilizing transposase RayT
MARPLRIQFENAYYHVTCRGNAGQKIFRNNKDRLAFLDLLERSSEIYQVHILAYVLMATHFHILVKTPLANLQGFMRHFNISYTSYYNRTYGKTGHLFQGRYKSFLIDADHYLQEVSRYIHLNPLRVKDKAKLNFGEKWRYLEKFSWSSYEGYLSSRVRKPFLRVEEVLDYFGGDSFDGKRKYGKFVEEGLKKEVRNPLEIGKGHGIVGETGFLEKVRSYLIGVSPKRREVPAFRKVVSQVETEKIVRLVSEEVGLGKEALMRKGSKIFGRGLLMELLYRFGGLNNREIGALMGVDYSTVSVERKRFLEVAKKDRKAKKQLVRIQRRLSQG